MDDYILRMDALLKRDEPEMLGYALIKAQTVLAWALRGFEPIERRYPNGLLSVDDRRTFLDSVHNAHRRGRLPNVRQVADAYDVRNRVAHLLDDPDPSELKASATVFLTTARMIRARCYELTCHKTAAFECEACFRRWCEECDRGSIVCSFCSGRYCQDCYGCGEKAPHGTCQRP